MSRLLSVFALFLYPLFPAISQNAGKLGAGHTQVLPCVNEGFELSAPGNYTGSANATAVNGWTISSQTVLSCSVSPTWTAGSPEFAIVQTPMFSVPQIGILGTSPFGGSHVAWLNNTTDNRSSTKIAQAVPVTTANSNFDIAFAMVLEDGNHVCCENSLGNVLVKDSAGSILSCLSMTFWASTCPGPVTNFSITNGFRWTNWQTRSINLNAYLGQTLTVEIIASDCIYGDHYGMMFVDTRCNNTPSSCNCSSGSLTSIGYCAGSPIATIQAPLGNPSYSWIAPSPQTPIPASQATLSAITITNPVAGNVYSVITNNSSGCLSLLTYTLQYTTVGAGTYSAQASCQPGSTGNATLFPTGSATGYTYTWYNSTGSVVGTSSALANAPAGNYIVHVGATAGCGTVVTNVQIQGINTSFSFFSGSSLTACSGQSLSTLLSFTGSPSAYTFSWSPPQFLSATNNSFVIITPTVASGNSIAIVYSVVMTPTVQNCPVTQTLMLTAGDPATPTVTIPAKICSEDAPIQLIANPAGGVFSPVSPGLNSNGLINPSAASPGVTSFNYSYSLGGCTKTVASQFTITTSPALSISGPTAICYGDTLKLTANGAHTYSWNTGSLTHSISEVLLQNTSRTVTTTDTVTGCNSSRSWTVQVNPLPQIMISGPLTFCSNAGTTLTASGGHKYLWFNSAQTASIQLNAANGGTIWVSVTDTLTGCKSIRVDTVLILQQPVLTVSGNTSVCEGETIYLSAAGATNFSWDNSVFGPTISIVPVSNSTILLTGDNGSGLCVDTLMVSYHVDPCTGLPENKFSERMKVYPSPFFEELHISVQENSTADFFDASGVLVLSKQVGPGSSIVVTSSWPAGVYFCMVKGASSVIRLVKE